jgi:hypothetical protein
MPAVPILSRKTRPLRSTSMMAPTVITMFRILIAVPWLAALTGSRPACCRMVDMNCSSELMPVAWLQPRITQASTNGST